MTRAVAASLLLGCAMSVCAQQAPAGTRSADSEDPVNQQIREAEAALEKQDTKGAEAMLKKIAAARPRDARVLYDLGFAEEANGEEDAAAKSYAASFAADGGFADPEVALGLLDARAGRTAEAHRELEAAAKVSAAPAELRARALRAMARLDAESAPAQAEEELLAAVKLSGETADDIALTAELADRAKDPADAEAAYRRLLGLSPGNVDATAGLAHALLKQNKTAEADTLLTETVKEHPHDPQLVSQLAAVYVAEGKAKEAAPLLEAARAANPKLARDPFMTALLARVYAMNDDNANAEKLYEQLVAASPNDPRLLDDLGGVFVKEQRYAEAQNVLTKAVLLRADFHDDGSWAVAEGHLAFAASKNGHPEVTLQALAARATVLPNSPAALFLQATAHDSLHQYKQAEQAYRAFLDLSGGKYPDQEFQARHRLVALEHMK